MDSEITRRLVLRLLVGGLGVGLFPLRVLGDEDAAGGPKDELVSETLRRLLPGLSSAVAIGRQALSEGAAERDRESLLAALGIEASERAASEQEVEALRGKLRSACREDFRHGRTRMLGGWVLSQTELRLAALVALENGA